MVVELEDVDVEPMGVKLRLPVGSKTLQSGKMATTYSYPVDGKLVSIDVSVRAFGESDLEKAKKTATQTGGRVADAKALGEDKLEVVLAPQGILQTVEVYRAERSVQCKGPKDLLPKLREICGSLGALAG